MTLPMLAHNYTESKIRFPVGMQPKIDGVRGLKLGEHLTGRSLEKHANLYTTQFFANPIYTGFDGELAASHETDSALCRLTSSALSTIKGEPLINWHVFDIIVPQTRYAIYQDRYAYLAARLKYYSDMHVPGAEVLKLVPMTIVSSLKHLRELDAKHLDDGYEGSILRDLNGFYKEGRSTVNEGGLLRMKHFIEEDAVVISLIEGDVNNNEKVVNALGRSERSSHQSNLVPNGLIGSLLCKDIKTGKEIIVGAGALDHKQRKFYFENPTLIIGKVIKYKYFPKGIKDKPRFPTFHSFRIKSDLII